MTADEVLIASPNCGLYIVGTDTEAHFFESAVHSSKLISASADYAQQCYASGASAQECSIFIKKQIPQYTSTNTSCPFPGKDQICLRNSTNLRIDTGLIDSHEHLGMNAAPKDRFFYRNVLECAPLRVQGFQRVVGSNNTWTNLADEFHYGSRMSGKHTNDSMTIEWPVKVPMPFHEYAIM